jgi:TonB family protein
LSRWGVDAKAMHALTRQPEPPGDLVTKFGPASYPAQSVRLGKQGRSIARLAIAPDGSVIDCRTVASAGFYELDQQTCSIARQLAYRPALGPDGRPAPSWAMLPVRWQLP